MGRMLGRRNRRNYSEWKRYTAIGLWVSDGYRGMRTEPANCRALRCVVCCWMGIEAFRNYLAGNRGKPPGNRRFNEMAGESVALNPALRERNRNLKACGLTGLLFLGWHRPCNP